MRILCISECYPSVETPQYGVFISQQVKALEALGNTVDVLMPQRSQKAGPMGQTEYGGNRVYSLPYCTIRYESFPVLAAKSAVGELAALLKENRYDLVAVHIVGDPFLLLTIKTCKKQGVPVVAHYHGLNVWEEYVKNHPLRQKFYAARRCKALRNTAGLVGVSNKVSDILRSRIRNVPVKTVYNGVDVELFREKKPSGDMFRVIGVGNLIEIKGFAYLLEAFAKLHEKHPRTHLDIVGDGVLRQSLQEQAKELGVADAVTFHGKVPYGRVAELMQEGDLFVLPSFYEALGCVYLEAMGCHLPTIGVEGFGIDEIIRDGENGLLTRPKDTTHLYEKMAYVLENLQEAARMGRAGYETACRFTWDASGKELNDFYNECVK